MSDWLGKMLYALTSAYNSKDYDNHQRRHPLETNIGKLFSIFAWGLDIVEEQAELIRLWDDLDNAEGAVLDRYGANFGVSRGVASDVLYRIFIRAKMISQLSGGDDETVLTAAAELLGVDPSDLLMEDIFPAKKALYVDLSLLSEERANIIEQIVLAIKRTMFAGVGLRLYVRTYRAHIYHVTMNCGGYVWSWNQAASPDSSTEFLQQTVSAGRHIGASKIGILPDSASTSPGGQSASPGRFYTTHISSKRITDGGKA